MPEKKEDASARRRERVPLLKPWKEEADGHRSNSWTIFFSFLKNTLLHAFMFMIVSAAFMTGYHLIPYTLTFLLIFFVLAFLSDAAYNYLVRGRLNNQAMGFAICAFAFLAGAVVGTSIDMTHLVDYWPYLLRRHYTNVAPDELAASHADASVIVFMEGARPDPTRAMGYLRHGNRYCVAPIALESGYSDDKASADVQYWAVGVDCCMGNKGFDCDDSQNPQARAGLVKMRKEDARFAGILSSDELSYYDKAVSMTTAKFDLTSPKERLYVRFVQDIGKTRDKYWVVAWITWTKMQFLFGLIWVVAGVMSVIVGASDPDDTSRYGDHVGDAVQGTLFNLNNYI